MRWGWMLALGLAACASSPTVPVSIAVTNPWWQAFHDPVLDDLVDRSLRANIDIQTAQASLRQARALRDIARAGTQPSLAVAGSVQRSKVEGAAPVSTYKPELDAHWEVGVFGANASALSASEADVRVAQLSLADVQLSVASEVALAYFQLCSQQAQWSLAQRSLAGLQSGLELTRSRMQAGLASAIDLAAAKTAVSQATAQLSVLQSGMAQNRHSLAVLTAQQPKALDGLEPRPVPAIGMGTDPQIPADVLRQRPDVRMAEQRAEAAFQRTRAAQAGLKPSLSLNGTLSWTAMTLSGLSSANGVGALLGSVSYPWLDGGAAQGQVSAQTAAWDQARLAYDLAVLTAKKDVEDALVALHEDHLRLQQLTQAALAAAETATLTQQRHASGLVDFQAVLEAERAQWDANSNVVGIQATLATDWVRLCKALGGKWFNSL